VKLEVHTQAGALSTLAAEWRTLLAANKRHTFFATAEWTAVSWRAFGEGQELRLLTMRDGAELIGIVPLAVTTGGERKVARFASYLEVTDYQDIIARPGREHAVWQAAIEYVAQQRLSLDLHNIPAASPTMAFFNGLAQDPAYAVTTGIDDVCPIISPLPADFETYLAGLDKKDRHELRRKLRRLLGNADAGVDVTWEFGNLQQAMDDFVRLHRLSSADKEQFMTPSMVGFFNDLAGVCHEHGWLRLGFITVRGVPVSTIMAFEYGDWFGLYNSGYDPEYEYLSVGLLLKALAIEFAIKTGKTCYDFLQGSERYKYDLGGKDTQVCYVQCTHR